LPPSRGKGLDERRILTHSSTDAVGPFRVCAISGANESAGAATITAPRSSPASDRLPRAASMTTAPRNCPACRPIPKDVSTIIAGRHAPSCCRTSASPGIPAARQRLRARSAQQSRSRLAIPNPQRMTGARWLDQGVARTFCYASGVDGDNGAAGGLSLPNQVMA